MVRFARSYTCGKQTVKTQDFQQSIIRPITLFSCLSFKPRATAGRSRLVSIAKEYAELNLSTQRTDALLPELISVDKQFLKAEERIPVSLAWRKEAEERQEGPAGP